MIDDYRFGSMTIDGSLYSADLKIIKGEVVTHWWRRKGHEVTVEDVNDVLAARPEVLVIGRGMPGLMRVHPSLKETLKDLRIRLVERPTDEAVQIFNDLSCKGKDVAGAFHLTC